MTRGKSVLSAAILVATLGVIAVLAVPAGVLMLLIGGVWNLGDRVLRKLDGA